MNLVAPLDEIEVGGKLIKSLYLSILEEIGGKELPDNFNKVLDCEGLGLPLVVLEREAGVVEFEVFVDPKGERVAFINSDVIVREEEKSVLPDEGAIGGEDVDCIIQFLLVGEFLDLLEERAGVERHAYLYIFMKIAEQLDLREVSDPQVVPPQVPHLLVQRGRLENIQILDFVVILHLVREKRRQSYRVGIALLSQQVMAQSLHRISHLFKIIMCDK